MDLRRLIEELDRRGFSPPRNLLLLSAVDSTNSLARRLVEHLAAEDERPEELLIVALEQTAGRGRGENSWQSPPDGGLWATRVVPLVEIESARRLPLLAATALCDGINSLVGGRCRLKWPNDLWIDRRKVGGILIEVLGGKTGPSALIGFGVNGNIPAETLPTPQATSLAVECGRNLSVAELCERLVTPLERALGEEESDGDLVSRFAAALVHRPGERLRFRAGGSEIDGLFLGLDPLGHLRLEVAGEERIYSAGEVIER